MIKESEERVRIEATIFVERDSQKGIVIGKGGKNKEVGKELDVILKCFSDQKFTSNYG